MKCIKTKELRSAMMTVESEKMVYAMHKNGRIEVQSAKMMAENALKD